MAVGGLQLGSSHQLTFFGDLFIILRAM